MRLPIGNIRVVVLIWIFLIMGFMSQTMNAQLSDYQLRLRSQAFFGFSRMSWSAETPRDDRTFKDNVEMYGISAGLSVGKNYKTDREFGYTYDFTNNKLGDSEARITEKGRMHEVGMFVSRLRGWYVENGSYEFFTFRSGVSFMHTREANPFLLSFTSPYELRTNWWGGYVGMELGSSYCILKSKFRLEWAVYYKYTFLQLTGAKTAVNDLHYDATGRLRLSGFGVQVSLMYYKSKPEEWKREF